MKRFFQLLTIIYLSVSLSPASAAGFVNLDVPFTPEIPDGIWIKPWNNACEEATIVMVQKYYEGNKLPKAEAKKQMSKLFSIENKIFGFNADTSPKKTAYLINNYFDFEAAVISNPTIDEIKNELDEGRPVISFHYGKNLTNPEHRWRVGGSYYHVLTINGYDDDTGEFIVNDSAAYRHGLDFRYKYDTVMTTLTDFNEKTSKTGGDPTVIYTKSKLLAKSKESNRIYLISHDTKYYVTSPRIFSDRGWKWSSVKTMDAQKITSMKTGMAIR